MSNLNLFNLGSNPINLALRLVLEVTVLISVGFWGFGNFENSYSYIMGIGIPMLMALLWGVFAVPNDPSRSGKTVFKTPGIIRLALELLFFSFGSYALYNLYFPYLFYAFCISFAFHYLISLDRIKWLLSQ